MHFYRRLLLGVVLLLQGCQPVPPAVSSETHTGNLRVVSLSPGITEIVYALGQGEHLVGVTRYGRFPLEARSKPSVGGYLDTNFEAIVRLAPDWVLLRKDNPEIIRHLKKLGLRVLAVEHRSLQGVLSSFASIGKVLGAEAPGQRLEAKLRLALQHARERSKGKMRPRILISVGRDVEETRLGKVYVAGKDGFYNQLLAVVGAKNAYEGKVAFPVFGPEGLTDLQPDAVIELANRLPKQGAAGIVEAWSKLPRFLEAKQKKIFVIAKDYASVPGPRLTLLLNDFEKIIQEVRTQ